MSGQPSLTDDQIKDIVSNIVVSVDLHENAIILSAYKLVSYFIKNMPDIEKILKVDITDDKKLVVYAVARSKNPFIESLVIKAILKNDILSMLKTKYDLIKYGDDVYIKVYMQNNQLQNMPTTTLTEGVDF